MNSQNSLQETNRKGRSRTGKEGARENGENLDRSFLSLFLVKEKIKTEKKHLIFQNEGKKLGKNSPRFLFLPVYYFSRSLLSSPSSLQIRKYISIDGFIFSVLGGAHCSPRNPPRSIPLSLHLGCAAARTPRATLSPLETYEPKPISAHPRQSVFSRAKLICVCG